MYDHLTNANSGVLMADTVHHNFTQKARMHLQETGIPVDVLQSTQENYKDQFSLRFRSWHGAELLKFCDGFQMAKMLLKMTALQLTEYDIEMAPCTGSLKNNLDLNLELGQVPAPEELRSRLLARQCLLTPNINSWRKTKAKSPVDTIVLAEGGSNLQLKNLLSPDINMYLVISALVDSLGSPASESQESSAQE